MHTSRSSIRRSYQRTKGHRAKEDGAAASNVHAGADLEEGGVEAEQQPRPSNGDLPGPGRRRDRAIAAPSRAHARRRGPPAAIRLAATRNAARSRGFPIAELPTCKASKPRGFHLEAPRPPCWLSCPLAQPRNARQLRRTGGPERAPSTTRRGAPRRDRQRRWCCGPACRLAAAAAVLLVPREEAVAVAALAVSSAAANVC
eukprot:364568-Chlamydomonas_euryale.AAC.2